MCEIGSQGGWVRKRIFRSAYLHITSHKLIVATSRIHCNSRRILIKMQANCVRFIAHQGILSSFLRFLVRDAFVIEEVVDRSMCFFL